MSGFNPQQLVNRGVCDSLDEADRVLCDWDDARALPRISIATWVSSSFVVNFGRRGRVVTSAGFSSPTSLAPDAPAIPISPRDLSSPVAQQSEDPHHMGSPELRKTAAAAAKTLCPWCAIERAYSGHGPAPRTGFVAVDRCARHAASDESTERLPAAQSPHQRPAA